MQFQSTLLSLAQWRYYESIDHPIWKFAQNNANAFNESIGESSLSTLKRITLSDTVRQDIKVYDNHFRNIRFLNELSIQIESNSNIDGSNSHVEVKPLSKLVVSTRAFLIKYLSEIKDNVIFEYSKDSFKKTHLEATNLMNPRTKRHFGHESKATKRIPTISFFIDHQDYR